jgi:hypothetical protein
MEHVMMNVHGMEYEERNWQYPVCSQLYLHLWLAEGQLPAFSGFGNSTIRPWGSEEDSASPGLW